MITEGLAREIYHISNFFNTTTKCSLEYLGKKVEIEVFSRYIKVFYKGEKIWDECMDEEIGNFGIESIQHLFYIIDKIEKGEDWKDLAFYEKPEDLNKFYKDEGIRVRKEILDFSNSDANKSDSDTPQEEQV